MKKLLFVAFFSCFYLLRSNLFAQCAMCKAVVESNIEAGGTTGLGINNGIIYLMIFPYLLIAGVGYLIYKNYKKNISTAEKDEQ